MTVIIIKDNGDTEAVSLTNEQAADVCLKLIDSDKAAVSNFACRFQPYSYYRSGDRTGRLESLA